MSDYTIVNGELYHYGVPGMKWGVRKTRGLLRDLRKAEKIGDPAGHNYAVSHLSSRKEKHTKQLNKLNKQEIKLAKKQAKLLKKRYKDMKKGNADMTIRESSKKEAKIAKQRTKVYMQKNLLEKTIKEIDHEFIDRGRHFLYMREDGVPIMGSTFNLRD